MGVCGQPIDKGSLDRYGAAGKKRGCRNMEWKEKRELLGMIRKRLLLIIIVTVLTVTVTGLLSFFVIKPVYEATATLLIQTEKENNQINYNDLIANQKLVKTYSEIMKSRYICEDVISRLSLNLTVDELLEKIRVKSTDESLLTSITVHDHDPILAAQIANTFAYSFATNLNKLMKVDNVSILDQASTQEKPIPVRPQPYVYMAIALVLGGMVAVGLALFLETLDKTITTQEELEQILSLPVLAVIADIEKIRKTKNKQGDMTEGGSDEIKSNHEEVNLSV